jgi:hypothetical protein
MDGQRIMFITNLIAGLLAFTSFNLKTRKCVSFYSDTGKFPKPYQTRPARQQRSSASSLLRQDSPSDDCVIDIRTIRFKKTYKNAASPEIQEGNLATMPTIKHFALTVKRL